MISEVSLRRQHLSQDISEVRERGDKHSRHRRVRSLGGKGTRWVPGNGLVDCVGPLWPLWRYRRRRKPLEGAKESHDLSHPGCCVESRFGGDQNGSRETIKPNKLF